MLGWGSSSEPPPAGSLAWVIMCLECSANGARTFPAPPFDNPFMLQGEFQRHH